MIPAYCSERGGRNWSSQAASHGQLLADQRELADRRGAVLPGLRRLGDGRAQGRARLGQLAEQQQRLGPGRAEPVGGFGLVGIGVEQVEHLPGQLLRLPALAGEQRQRGGVDQRVGVAADLRRPRKHRLAGLASSGRARPPLAAAPGP